MDEARVQGLMESVAVPSEDGKIALDIVGAELATVSGDPLLTLRGRRLWSGGLKVQTVTWTLDTSATVVGRVRGDTV